MPLDNSIYIDGELYVKLRSPDLTKVGEDTKTQFSSDVANAIIAAPPAVGQPAAPMAIAQTVATMVWMGYASLNETQLAALVDLQVRADRCDKSLISMVLKCKVSVVNALVKKAQATLDAEAAAAQEEADA
jgi:hypothetical protein